MADTTDVLSKSCSRTLWADHPEKKRSNLERVEHAQAANEAAEIASQFSRKGNTNMKIAHAPKVVLQDVMQGEAAVLVNGARVGYVARVYGKKAGWFSYDVSCRRISEYPNPKRCMAISEVVQNAAKATA